VAWEGLHKGPPLCRQLLLLEVGSNLLPGRRLVAFEPGLIGLVEGLDLLLGDQRDLRGHLSIQQRLDRDAPLRRLSGQESFGDQCLNLLALEVVDLLFKLGELCGDGLLDLFGRDRLPVQLRWRLPLRGRLGHDC
jgi:hypothetical protein